MTSTQRWTRTIGIMVSLAGIAACDRGRPGPMDTMRGSIPSKPQMASLAGAAPAESVAALPPGATGKQGPGEWWMPGRDLASSRYSALNEINVSNAKSLKVATTFSTGVLHGHEGQPLVVCNISSSALAAAKTAAAR